MGNIQYETSSVIAGVSTRPYALRTDGHALDQENCMLSTKYGLCKRPGTQLLQLIESSTSTGTLGGCVTFPLYRDDKERIVIGFSPTSWQVFDKWGKKELVAHFPSSTNSAKTAAQVYADNGATYGPLVTSTTLGDVTWISDPNVSPKMKDDVWEGYTEVVNGNTITNDQAFSIWVRHIVVTGSTSPEFEVQLSLRNIETDAVVDYRVFVLTNTGYSDTGQSSTLHNNLDALKILPSAQRVATALSFQLTKGNFDDPLIASVNWDQHFQDNLAWTDDFMEATNLNSWPYDDAGTGYVSGGNSGEAYNNHANASGVTSIMGRYGSQGSQPTGTSAGHLLDSIAVSGTQSGGTNWGVCGWKNVDDITDLPPNSWEDHTLKVGMSDSFGGFYMRFVSDDLNASPFSNVPGGAISITETLKLPKTGHWEEYCGVDVKQSIDSSTMPLLFVRRPDKTFALMEARGEITVNDTPPQEPNPDENWVRFDLDNDIIEFPVSSGFTNDADNSPLVVGDTIQFRGNWGDGGDGVDSNLELDKDYYIINKTWYSNSLWNDQWAYQISETKGGDAFDLEDGVLHNHIEVVLTTYKNFDWTKREAGNEDTNPVPDFIGGHINQVFNYQDRLGFLSEGMVNFTGTGDYFNFFRTTVRDLNESDPFGLAPVTEHGDILKFALPFNQSVILISNKGQFAVSGEGGFGPSTAEINKISQLSSDFYGMPVAVGNHLFLSYANEDASGVYNLRPSKTLRNKLDPMDTTLDVPGYIPVSPRRMVGNEKHNMLFVLDDGGRTDTGENQNLYVHSWKDVDGKVVHSAWTKWTFNASNPKGDDYSILDMLTVGDRIYLIVETNSSICLEFIDLDLSTEDVRLSQGIRDSFTNLCIDRKCTSTTAAGLPNIQDTQVDSNNESLITPLFDTVWDGTNTIITPKFKLNGNTKENLIIVLDDGTTYDMDTTGEGALSVSVIGQLVNIGADAFTGYLPKITVSGVNLRDHRHFYLGLKYNMRSKFGPFIPTQQQQTLGGRNIFIRSGSFTFSKAYQANITVFQDKEYTHTLDATPSGWARNHLKDPENIQEDLTLYFGDYADVYNKWRIYSPEDSQQYRFKPNYTRSPTGTITADFIEATTDPATDAGQLSHVYQTLAITPTLNQKYTTSLYVKKTSTADTFFDMVVELYSSGVAKEAMTVRVDLDAGTIASVTEGDDSATAYGTSDATISAVGADWVRVTATLNDSTGTTGEHRCSLYMLPQFGDTHIIVWGVRLDKAATAAIHHPQVPNKTGDIMFGIRKDMPHLEFELTNSTPWNSMFQLLNYDLTIQENT